jgi:hypothetical protein
MILRKENGRSLALNHNTDENCEKQVDVNILPVFLTPYTTSSLCDFVHLFRNRIILTDWFRTKYYVTDLKSCCDELCTNRTRTVFWKRTMNGTKGVSLGTCRIQILVRRPAILRFSWFSSVPSG